MMFSLQQKSEQVVGIFKQIDCSDHPKTFGTTIVSIIVGMYS